MKVIRGTGWYEMNGKHILLVSEEYNGSPSIMWTYDILICSEKLFNRYKDNLIASHLTEQGWYPNVRFI